VFTPAEASDQRLVLYSPVAESDTPAKLAALMEDVAEPQMVEEALAV